MASPRAGVVLSAFAPLPRRKGRVTYRKRDGDVWGFEEWAIGQGADGLRVMSAHCEMALGDERVVRDSVLSVHPDFHPHDAFVRIMRDGTVSGTGWFHFTDVAATCESWTAAEGRITQSMPIVRPIRGFGIHAVQGDGWLAATFPYDKGPGHTQFFGRNLLHSVHHLGATGPFISTTGSGLTYVGPETIDVPAGTFDCHRIRFVGLTNNHPAYDMWVTRDGEFLYVKGDVEGYMDSVFELASLSDG
ncbi:DUF3108 domain-containing protein [Glacieibacterium frigidum]|uniref:DUF3108 domain-containing protein n=1 Tax=Glacieibacterium frigidum TaxID=2593303 RepID=A0A552UIH6_9SPHN|nr:DUF3108 domain-containing protein [Glacieibacterium frigidum]TRW18028.1 DUF3108 domain-containing protein [Glacieibacterium frigidum]